MYSGSFVFVFNFGRTLRERITIHSLYKKINWVSERRCLDTELLSLKFVMGRTKVFFIYLNLKPLLLLILCSSGSVSCSRGCSKDDFFTPPQMLWPGKQPEQSQDVSNFTWSWCASVNLKVWSPVSALLLQLPTLNPQGERSPWGFLDPANTLNSHGLCNKFTRRDLSSAFHFLHFNPQKRFRSHSHWDSQREMYCKLYCLCPSALRSILSPEGVMV